MSPTLEIYKILITALFIFTYDFTLKIMENICFIKMVFKEIIFLYNSIGKKLHKFMKINHLLHIFFDIYKLAFSYFCQGQITFKNSQQQKDDLIIYLSYEFDLLLFHHHLKINIYFYLNLSKLFNLLSLNTLMMHLWKHTIIYDSDAAFLDEWPSFSFYSWSFLRNCSFYLVPLLQWWFLQHHNVSEIFSIQSYKINSWWLLTLM